MSNQRQQPDDESPRMGSGQRHTDDDDDSQLRFFGRARNKERQEEPNVDESRDDYFNRAEFNRTTFGVQRRGQGQSGRRPDCGRQDRSHYDRNRNPNQRSGDGSYRDRDPQRQARDPQHQPRDPQRPYQRRPDSDDRSRREQRQPAHDQGGRRQRDDQRRRDDRGRQQDQPRNHANDRPNDRVNDRQNDRRNDRRHDRQHSDRRSRDQQGQERRQSGDRPQDNPRQEQQRESDRRGSRRAERRRQQAQDKVRRVALVDGLVGLQWASRRISLHAIHDGRVTVNRKVVQDPNMIIQIPGDAVLVDGQGIPRKTLRPLMFVFNKPITLPGSRETGKPSLYTVLDNKRAWYSPNGVLPASASGIILLTNDKQHRNEQASPLRGLTAEYRIKVHRKPKATELKQIAKHIGTLVGEKDKHLAVTIHAIGTRQTWLSVVTQRASVHQIMKALQMVGIEPLRVDRYRLGPFTTDVVHPHSWARLADEESAALLEAAQRADGSDAVWNSAMPAVRPLGSAIEFDGYEIRNDSGLPADAAEQASDNEDG